MELQELTIIAWGRLNSMKFDKKYTFVKFASENEGPQRKLDWDKGSLNGYIEYTIKTVTPLFIPNTTNEDVFNLNKEEHNSYAFYSYEDLSIKHDDLSKITPIIPGSEIRGMYRSYYEFLSDSCLSKSNDDVITIIKNGKIKKEKTINIIDKRGKYSNEECNKKNGVCHACSLFGTVNDSFAVASKLRFTDLTPKTPNGWYGEKCHLKPLGSPKLKDEIDSIGRKMYNFNSFLKENDYKDKEAKKLGCTIVPIKKDIEFLGKVYFESLSGKDLNELIYLIGCNGKINEFSNHGYKLGRGKPLGLGSIVVKVNKIKLRKTVKDESSVRITEESYNDKYTKPSFKQENEFIKITSPHSFDNQNKSRGKGNGKIRKH